MKRCKLTKLLEVSPAFAALLCAYYYFDPAGTFFPLLTAAGLHELGHLLALRMVGARVHKLCLTGGGAILRTDPLPYAKEIFVAAAGPAVNLALLLLLARREPKLALLSLGLFAYNMLPFYPLDGGRIFRAVLQLLLPERLADGMERAVCILCLIFIVTAACYFTCVWHAGLWPVLVCALLLLRIGESARKRPRRLPT